MTVGLVAPAWGGILGCAVLESPHDADGTRFAAARALVGGAQRAAGIPPKLRVLPLRSI